jgi:hypothetical protein
MARAVGNKSNIGTNVGSTGGSPCRVYDDVALWSRARPGTDNDFDIAAKRIEEEYLMSALGDDAGYGISLGLTVSGQRAR